MAKTALWIVGSFLYAMAAIVLTWLLLANFAVPAVFILYAEIFAVGLLVLLLAIPPWPASRHQISWILVALAELAVVVLLVFVIWWVAVMIF